MITMERIINQGYYEKCRMFIQEKLETDAGWLTSETKKKLVECYEYLNEENAKEIYEKLVSIYGTASSIRMRELNIMWLKGSGTVAVLGLSIVGTGYLLEKLPWTNGKMNYDKVKFVGGVVTFVGIMAILATGH